MKSIFEFDDYKAFLIACEEQRASFQRGFRTRLATELGCQNTYVTHVLNNNANFSLEQGMRVANFLGLEVSEKKYFLLLIEFYRAGTEELKKHFQEELGILREKNLVLQKHIKEAKTLSIEAQSIYYSHWMYAAIHMLSTLKTHRTLEAMMSSLKLPDEAIKSAILFLISVGLLIEKEDKFWPGPTNLHLGKDSHQIRQHHINWRIAAIESLVQIEKNDIHYSTLSTISKVDAEKIKARLVQEIQNYTQTVQKSNEETMYGFNLDFYCLLKK
jgi:uncharacterized protein (TIGR02147 family)